MWWLRSRLCLGSHILFYRYMGTDKEMDFIDVMLCMCVWMCVWVLYLLVSVDILVGYGWMDTISSCPYPSLQVRLPKG